MLRRTSTWYSPDNIPVQYTLQCPPLLTNIYTCNTHVRKMWISTSPAWESRGNWNLQGNVTITDELLSSSENLAFYIPEVILWPGHLSCLCHLTNTNDHLLLFYATGDEAVAYMFYRCFFVFFCFFLLFFLFFFRPQKIWDNRSRERLNGFSWNVYQTIPGKMEFATSCRRLAKVVQPPGEWRMLMIWRRLRYKIMSARMDLI